MMAIVLIRIGQSQVKIKYLYDQLVYFVNGEKITYDRGHSLLKTLRADELLDIAFY